jgi:hypothetical protein
MLIPTMKTAENRELLLEDHARSSHKKAYGVMALALRLAGNRMWKMIANLSVF